MIEAARIADVLGGTKVLGLAVRSLGDLDARVADGLPRRSLEACMERIFDGARERRAALYRIVPKATFARQLRKMGPAASERTARVAKLIATAEFVWDDAEDAAEWLRSPHPELGGKSPLGAAATEIGALRAETVLWQMAHGVPA